MYCTISTYSSSLMTCDHQEEMSISSVPDMMCDNFDISLLAEIWDWEGPKILTSLFNQTPYLTVFFQLARKTKNRYGGCYCSLSRSIKPSSLMCLAARNVQDTEGGLMAKNDKNYQPSALLSLRNVQRSLCGTGRGGEGRGRWKKVANTLYVEDHSDG